MKSVANIHTEMARAAFAATDPFASQGEQPMTQSRETKEEVGDTVQPWMREAFEELRRAEETDQPFLLLPCTVNGEPSAVIAYANHIDDRKRVHVVPLFVAMTPGMVLVDPLGRRAGGERA